MKKGELIWIVIMDQKKVVPNDNQQFWVHFALCVPSDSDPNFQKSYQNLITFLGEILPNSDSKFWLGGNNKGEKLQLNFWNWQKQRYTLKGGLMSHY